MKEEKFNTWKIVRNGRIIAEKTYNTQKSTNQLRYLAINYMVNNDISTKYHFNIDYENK